MTTLPPFDGEGPEFQFSSLAWSDRQNIVEAAGSQAAGTAFVSAAQFQLSALGAFFDLTGSWPGTINDLVSWRQVTTSGRDQFVKVVYAGFLFPLGHRATLTTVHRRVLIPDPFYPDSYADAYMQHYTRIHVTQPVVDYPTYAQPWSGGAWPFSSAEMLTLVTPDIDQPPIDTVYQLIPPIDSDNYPQAFFPSVFGTVFPWNVHLIDAAGTNVHLQLPLAFIFGEGNPYTASPYDPTSSTVDSIIAAYNALGQADTGPGSFVTSQVAGTPIQYASPVTTGGPGLTVHPTQQITLGACTVSNVPTPTPGVASTSPQYIPAYPPGASVTEAELTANEQPAFFPSLLQARVRLPAAETLSRSSFTDGSGSGVGIFLYGPYVTDGFSTPSSSAMKPAVRHLAAGPVDPTGSTNPGSVYAGLLNSPPLSFPSDMVGGLANPNLGVNGLSAAAGAIGGTLSQYASNAEALISEYFGDLTSSNFLGGLSLGDILGEFLGDLQSPSISQQVAADGTRTVTYTMQTSLQAVSEFGFQPLSVGGQYGNGNFNLTATLVVSPSGATTYDIEGEVDAFTITILDAAQVIGIPFGAADGSTPGATFGSSSGAKTSIKVNVGQPSFLGALDFVNTLEQFLSDIGGSGVSINVGPTQISASLSLSLPSVGVGVFNLENLSLSASVVVPFLGGATIATFGFCSAEQPFSLTVLCFGGGGYVLVSVGLNSLQSLTASFDFEGQLALDLGVASGGVTAMAGFTFMYTAGQGATLTAFVRITGEVEVLGILSITLELQLSLSYTTPNTATGTATMTVSVSVCFFSVSVPITVSKSFQGPISSGPMIAGRKSPHTTEPAPYANDSQTTFEDQMPTAADWSAYCSSFAS